MRSTDRSGLCLMDADVACRHVFEDEGAMLRPPVGVCVSPFHAPDGDKVAGRLTRTESLADDTVLPHR